MHQLKDELYELKSRVSALLYMKQCRQSEIKEIDQQLAELENKIKELQS